MPSDAADPHAEYRHRLADRKAVAAARSRRHALCGNARLAVVLAAAALAWMSLAGGWLSPYWLALPAVAFLALTFVQDRARRAWRRAERAVAFYERGLARLEHRWSGGGQPGTRFLDPDHPYALDLDLFGPGSLFELLCTARTRHGEDTLAEWLLAPTDPDTVRARQAAVADLRPRLDLREELSLQGAVVPGGVELSALAAWGAAPPALPSRLLRLAALLLALLALAALLGWWLLDLGPTPFLVAVILEAGFALALRRRVEQVIGPVDRRSRDLALLAGLLSRLEREEFTAPRLRELQAALLTDGLSPSGQIARLAALVELLDSRKNIYFAPLASLLLWGTQLAFAIEAWRGRAGKAIGRWLEGVGEFEALCALSAFAYENPADPFPEVLAEGPVYDGEGLGHPLIPAGRCVPNDVRLGGELRLLVISGSNMSGKSTLLRTVGVNAVLALAGAPVRAKRLTLSPVAVGATLRIQDSLQEGRSRFFAEVTRVRQLVDLARGPLPLLFLLDEVFHGTNSHDRRIGAEAVVRGLVRSGAIGLITTHDLALTHIAEELGPAAVNVHFADHFENGAMVFDYRMQPGVVRHSNALALMRAVGLEV